MSADVFKGSADNRACGGDEVSGSPHRDSARWNENRLVRRFFAVHQAVEKFRSLIAGTSLVVFYGRQRNRLVFADEPVAAYAEDGHIFGNRQPSGEAGAKGAGGVGIVVGEKGKRLGSGTQLVAKPAVEPGEVVQPFRRRLFCEDPSLGV